MDVRASFLLVIFLSGSGAVPIDDDDEVTAEVVHDFPVCMGWL